MYLCLTHSLYAIYGSRKTSSIHYKNKGASLQLHVKKKKKKIAEQSYVIQYAWPVCHMKEE